MITDFKLYSPCCCWYLEIQTDCYKVADLIVHLFGGFIVFLKPQKKSLKYLFVSVMKCDAGYLIFGKNRKYKIKDLSNVGFYLYAIIDKLIEGNMDDKFYVFHGGIIAKDSTAYCIIAPTMTGKSTFVTYFSLNGYTYLADDYIFVDRIKQTIYPLPLPVSLRDIAILEGAVQNQFLIFGYNELRGELTSLVDLFKDNIKDKIYEYRLEKLLFINRTNQNEIRTMGKGEVYQKLLFNMKNALNLEREIATINSLVNNVTGYDLLYCDFEYVTECLNKMVD